MLAVANSIFQSDLLRIIFKIITSINFSTWDSEDDAALKKAVKLYGSDWIASKSFLEIIYTVWKSQPFFALYARVIQFTTKINLESFWRESNLHF